VIRKNIESCSAFKIVKQFSVGTDISCGCNIVEIVIYMMWQYSKPTRNLILYSRLEVFIETADITESGVEQFVVQEIRPNSFKETS